MFSAISFITADAVTELQVSNSKLAELETAFATQKSEVRLLRKSTVLTNNILLYSKVLTLTHLNGKHNFG